MGTVEAQNQETSTQRTAPSQTERVLVVEDDESLCRLLDDEIRDAGLDVHAVRTAEEAQPLIESWAPDLVISDLKLPGADGLELLRYARSTEPPPAFLVITAFGTVPQAVEALKAGADDFLTKPLDLDHLMVCLQRAMETRRLKREVQRFRALMEEEHFHGQVGQSRAMRVLFDTTRQVANASGPVLIVGESGTGKELVARAIHRESPRADGPFLAINCAGIPEELLESEFFGHTAGAFTGATQSRKGLFAEAQGGSLLLDEIAEMPFALQAKLLRILQDGRVRPVGSNREMEVDVRIIASTNRDLEEEVRQGRFREDLFYRLETFMLQVPPLRERGEDIELLAGRFLNRFNAQMGKDVRGFTGAALERLKSYSFPGNVRELQNAIERAVTFCSDTSVGVEHLPDRLRRSGNGEPEGDTLRGLPEKLLAGNGLPTLEELERRYIRYVLDRVGGNKRRAALALGIGRRTLYRRLGEGDEGNDE